MYAIIDFVCIGLLDLSGARNENYKIKTNLANSGIRTREEPISKTKYLADLFQKQDITSEYAMDDFAWAYWTCEARNPREENENFLLTDGLNPRPSA